MLPQVVDALHKQEGVHDWLLRQTQKKSTQHYVIGARTENRRTVHSEQIVVTVMNDHRAGKQGQGLARGEAQVTLLPTDRPKLEERLSQAVFMASLTDNPLYGLPGAASYPRVELADPEMQRQPREVAEHLVQQLLETLAQEKGVRLSSAEVFIEERESTLQNSRGASGSQVSTNLLFDFVLLAAGDTDEMEAQIAFQRRRAADLDVPTLVRRQAQYARDALSAQAPKTGVFPVVVSDDALAELLMGEGDYSPLILRSSAQFKYQGLTTWETGKSMLTETPSGDPFTLYSNALLPFGTASGRFDGDGAPGQRALIIEKGVLSRFWATQRYADYLQIPATGQFGNMEVTPGSVAFQDFSGSGPLYHIVAFSAMSPDPITGDFVGEIRLGYEIHQGHAHPIRGGSISGNLFAALATAQLSQETVFLGHYFGPRGMLFPRITVAGK